MTVSEAKAELKQFKQDLLFVERKEYEIERLSRKIDAVISKGYSNEYDLRSLEMLYADYIQSIIAAYRHRLTVENTINRMPQPFKNILMMLYLDGKNMTYVARKLNYNYAYTSRLNMIGIGIYAQRRSL